MLDDVLAQFPGRLEELVHDLSVGAALETVPDGRGQAMAAERVVEALELDQGVSPVAFGHPRKASADADPERVDDGSQMHAGASS
ncbi:MAG TPA: hypothetical protein VJ735_18705 [Actinomycetes bacterium]|nr:hypothetical protein [Actinomycetes bacterium]